MFERFTNNARKAVIYAQEEARAMKHGYIGTEHLMLALLQLLEELPHKDRPGPVIPKHELAREEVLKISPEGANPHHGHIPFTPRTKKVLEFALREALRLGHNWIGPEHLTLGLIREGEGIGVQVLSNLGLDLDEWARILRETAPPPEEADSDAHNPLECPKCPETIPLRGRKWHQMGETVMVRVTDRLCSCECHGRS